MSHFPLRVPPTWLVAIGALSAVHLTLGVHSAWRSSVTHDEYWHVPAGLAVWKLGCFDADNLNPPLARAWSALPLAILGARIGEPIKPNDAFTLGDRFLTENRDRYHEFFALARMMNLFWSVLSGILIAAWGRELFGELAAVVAAALWFSCPIVLSNAGLATPDASAAFFFVATPYAIWRFAHQATWRHCLVVGLLLGAAQLVKFTDILLYPIAVMVWLIVRCRSRLPAVAARRATGQWITALGVSLLVLNAGYLFQGTGRKLNSYQFTSRGFRALAETVRPIAGVWVLAPRDYVEGFDRQRSVMEGTHPVFLDGMWNSDGTGFADYYLLAFAYKWPHATQVLVLTAMASCLFSRAGRQKWRVQLILLLPSALIVGIASASGMQLGIRYVLPAFPLIYLFAGQVGLWLTRPRWNWSSICVGACLAALPFGLRYHPHHLAYFNELSGGPVGGRNHLLDSNIDWGQDLCELRDYLHEREIKTVGLAYFGMVPPAQMGIDYHLPPSFRQVDASGRVPPGWYAVSVNFVQGRRHTIRTPDDQIIHVGFDEFGYFRWMTPVARLGWSIDVYNVPEVARTRNAPPGG